MRTRTFKRVGLVVLLVAFGAVVLTGCVLYTYRAYYAGSEGLGVSVQAGSSETKTNLVVTTADRTFIVHDDGNTLRWYYDVPAGNPEYVIVVYASGGMTDSNISFMDLHFLASKNPDHFGK